MAGDLMRGLVPAQIGQRCALSQEEQGKVHLWLQAERSKGVFVP